MTILRVYPWKAPDAYVSSSLLLPLFGHVEIFRRHRRDPSNFRHTAHFARASIRPAALGLVAYRIRASCLQLNIAMCGPVEVQRKPKVLIDVSGRELSCILSGPEELVSKATMILARQRCHSESSPRWPLTPRAAGEVDNGRERELESRKKGFLTDARLSRKLIRTT